MNKPSSSMTRTFPGEIMRNHQLADRHRPFEVPLLAAAIVCGVALSVAGVGPDPVGAAAGPRRCFVLSGYAVNGRS